MFAGLVEEIGVVREASRELLTFEAHKVLEETKVGDSIAVNGVCLTVVSLGNHRFAVNVMPETLRRTNLGKLHYGDQVNLERALMMRGRLGGHFVLGHVDDVGEVMNVTSEGDARIMRVSPPRRLMSYIVDRGFIAADGVSLTIAGLDDISFIVSLVGYTAEHTTLERREPGDVVNLEVDILAKYVENLMEQERRSLDSRFLREYGFVGGIDVG